MNIYQYAPIVFFVYNRLDHTIKTIEALQKNYLAPYSDLYIFSDGFKSDSDKTAVNQVRQYIKTITGFKTVQIREHEKNFGLADSVIKGVTEILNNYNNVIVMEDDLITTPNFLDFMNHALKFYQDDKRIFSISGYIFPHSPIKTRFDVIAFPRASTWGWATWTDRWQTADWDVKGYTDFIQDKKQQKQFNFGGDDLTGMLQSQMEGRINSWGIRWIFTHFQNNANAIFPIASKVFNIGHDGSGVHCGPSEVYNVDLDKTLKREFMFPEKWKVKKNIVKNVRRIFNNIVEPFSVKKLLIKIIKKPFKISRKIFSALKGRP